MDMSVLDTVWRWLQGVLTTGERGGDERTDGRAATDDPARDQVPLAELIADNVEEITTHAGTFADRWDGLDFSVASLGELDRVFEDQREHAGGITVETERGDSQTFAPLASGAASYFGETLVRNYNVEWRADPEYGWGLALPDGTLVNVFSSAHAALNEGPVFVAMHDAFVADHGIDGDRLDPDGGQPVTTQTALAGEESVVDELPDDAAEFVAAWPEYALDYTPESLAALDELVDTEFDSDEFTGETLGGDDEMSVELFEHALGAGAYYGEVFRRATDGMWRETDDGFEIRYDMGIAEAGFDPIVLAAGRLTGEADSFGDHYEEVTAVSDEVAAAAEAFEDSEDDR